MPDESQCWRIRLKCGGRHDVTRVAWEENVVGIWYGAATAEQVVRALELDNSEAVEFLSSLPKQKGLWEQTKRNLDTIRRFFELSGRDWVFTYFDDSLHFARVVPPITSDETHKWNFDGEIFKFCSITAKKSFALSQLPDGFRVLTMAGRGNVHRIGSADKLVRILAQSATVREALQDIRAMHWNEWLDILGPASWESISLGYLSMETGFVPTGLDVGGTLPTFDIIGRDKDGKRILAQCKKNPSAVPMDEEFLRLATDSNSDAQYFYFSYGGTTNTSDSVRLVTRGDIENWFESNPNGRKYLDWIRS
jgi:hypothetical protein